jgi:hypothetical protein
VLYAYCTKLNPNLVLYIYSIKLGFSFVQYRLNNPCIKKKIKKNRKPIINTLYMYNARKQFKNYIHA